MRAVCPGIRRHHFLSLVVIAFPRGPTRPERIGRGLLCTMQLLVPFSHFATAAVMSVSSLRRAIGSRKKNMQLVSLAAGTKIHRVKSRAASAGGIGKRATMVSWWSYTGARYARKIAPPEISRRGQIRVAQCFANLNCIVKSASRTNPWQTSARKFSTNFGAVAAEVQEDEAGRCAPGHAAMLSTRAGMAATNRQRYPPQKGVEVEGVSRTADSLGSSSNSSIWFMAAACRDLALGECDNV